MDHTYSAGQISLLEYLNTIDTPTLSNAIELCSSRLKAEGYAPLQVHSIFPELGRMCGHAVTAHVETVTQTEPVNDETAIRLFEAIAASPKPAVVTFQEIGGCADYAAHCGEVMATIYKRMGAIGLVTDCAVRDIAEVRALKFHYFARGKVASHANFRIARVGIPIQIMGLVIQPGDILHGDENGLIVVPKLELETLSKAVDQIRSKERTLMEFIRGADFSMAELPKKFREC